MLKTTISSVSLVALLLTGAPVFAAEATMPTTATTTATAPVPSGNDVSACMKKATNKKNAAMKAAEKAYKTAKNTKDKAKMKAAQDTRKKAQKNAQAMFEKDRKACTAVAGAPEKKKEAPKNLEQLIAALQEKLKVLEAKIAVLEALINPKSATVTLSAQNASGESGTATLKEDNGKIKVVLDLTGAPAGVMQPAHVHMGSCANLGAVKYPLTFPTDGKSETILDVKWADLKAGLPLAINVHKSPAEATVYVACGDLSL
ncbi:MAG: hypothetical protein Q8P56_05345 [Candidatus Uhrbacteria bacterium]|nr:hypothetical protein [Candidatus Uhrbacteria bacterium]